MADLGRLINRPSGQIVVRMAVMHEAAIETLILLVEVIGPTLLVHLVSVVLRTALLRCFLLLFGGFCRGVGLAVVIWLGGCLFGLWWRLGGGFSL